MSILDPFYINSSAPDASKAVPPSVTTYPGEFASALGVRRPQSDTDVDQFKSIAQQLKAEAQALDQREAQLVEREIDVAKCEQAVAAERKREASTME